MATFQRLRRAREQRAAASAVAAGRAAGLAVPAVATPQEVELHTTMQHAVRMMEQDTRPNNTAIAMDPKKEEWYQYCDKLYPDEDLKYLVTHEKAYNFMCYQMFREEKKRGGDKALLKQNIFFDYSNYKTVTSKFKKEGGVIIDYPTPVKPVGMASFTSHRAALKQIFHEQQARYRTITGTWELIWLPCFKTLQEHVKLRKARTKRANFEEKVDGAFAPYQMVEKFDEIEEAFWNNCNKPSPRQSLIIDKNTNDIHPLYVLIMQMPIGKTNKGHIRCGRGTRHRLVKHCFVGAMAFYCTYRFEHSGEFADMTVEDWLDNSTWFGIKLLADLSAPDRTQKMQNDGYSEKVKEILNSLGLPTNKLLHLGRNVGSKLLDLLEEWKEEKRAMGQWSPDVMDNSYSSKLPMRPMRKLAGFTREKQPYYNQRTQVEPKEDLLYATPIGSWCYDMYYAAKERAEAARGNQHQTALQVLKFFCYLNQIFLQDAAAMIVEHGPDKGDRHEMPMFKEIAVLRSKEFKEYTETMRTELSKKDDPMNASLQAVLPEVQERMGATHHEVELLRGDVQNLRTEFTNLRNDIHQDSRQKDARDQARDQRLAATLRALANSIGGKVDEPQDMIFESSQQSPSVGAPDAHQVVTPSPSLGETGESSEREPEETLADGRNAIRIPMERKYNSLSCVYNEWFGLDEYADSHGGIAGREKKFKSNWRKGIVPPQVFSRTKRAIAGIQEFAKRNGLREPEGVASLETMFEQCKYSVANLVNRLSDLGYIEKKKPRGKKKNNDDSS